MYPGNFHYKYTDLYFTTATIKDWKHLLLHIHRNPIQPKWHLADVPEEYHWSKKHCIIMATPTQENLRDLCDWATQKGLEITIAKTFPMQEFKEAYQFARQGGVIGKVVFTM